MGEKLIRDAPLLRIFHSRFRPRVALTPIGTKFKSGSLQVQSKSDRLINLLDLFRRESRDPLLDQNFRQSRDIVKIDHATSRHAVTSIQDNFNWDISNGTCDRRDRNGGAYAIRRIAA